MSQDPIAAQPGNASQEVLRIGLTSENGSSVAWNDIQLADLPSGYAQEVVADLTPHIGDAMEDVLRELKRITTHRLTVFIPVFDAATSEDGSYGRLSDLIALCAAHDLVLRDLRVASIGGNSNGDKGIWISLVRHDEMPYDGERLSLLQSATTTIYEHVARYSFLTQLVKGKRVLDVGCGVGFGSAFLSAFASEIVAIDVSDEAISDAKKFRSMPGVYYERRDALSEDAIFQQFDVVICLEVIEHLSAQSQQRLAQQMSRWITQDGLVICSTPNPAYDPPNPFHHAPLDAKALDALFAPLFPHRVMCANAIAMGGIVIPAQEHFDSEIQFFDWDEQGTHINLQTKDQHRKTHYVLIGSPTPIPTIKCNITLDIKNELLQSFQRMRTKDHLFRSEEGSVFRNRIQQKQNTITELSKIRETNHKEINALENSLSQSQNQLAELENHLHELDWLSRQQQEIIIEKEDHNISLNNQLIEQEHQIGRQEEELSQQKATNDALDNQLRDSLEAIEQQQELINQKQQIIDRQQESHNLLAVNIQEKQQVIDQQQESNDLLAKDIEQKQSQITQYQKTITRQEIVNTELETQISKNKNLIARQQEGLAAARTHRQRLESSLQQARQHHLDVRAALIRTERERLHLHDQLESRGHQRLRRLERLYQWAALAYRAAFAPVAVPAIPPRPQTGDREPETVAFWQYTCQQFTASHRELVALVQQIEGAPKLNRLRAVARRLRSWTGRGTPPAHVSLPPSFFARSPLEGAQAHNPEALFQHVQRLHAHLTALAQRLEHRSARFYRLLYPLWDKSKRAWGRPVPAQLPPATSPRSSEAAPRRLAAQAVAVTPPARTLPPEACPDLITIVTPTYNRKTLVQKAVASVLGQTYTNWELIVVDDGSTDGTIELMDDYQDPRICWVAQPRRGVCQTRNTAIKLARGQYIAFLDSDNVWRPEYLEKMHRALAAAPDHVAAVYCNLNLFYDDKFEKVMDEHYDPSVMFHRPQIDLNAFMVRRQPMEREGGFDTRMNKWVDYELMLRLSRHGDFQHVHETLVDYFRLADGITRAKETERPMGPNLAVIRETRRSQLRVGYVHWDYPAASQAFAHRELEALQASGVDVRVYYKEDAEPAASPRPDAPSYKVQGPEELAHLAQQHGVHMLHGYFVYPHTTTLVWPAAEQAGIPFSFAGHGVDIFHYQNEQRSRLKEIANSPLCKGAFVIGSFHRQYFLDRGVPHAKLHVNRCLVDDAWLYPAATNLERPVRRIIQVSRFIDKKDPLLFLEVARACQQLDIEFELYGFGPLEAEVLKAAEGLRNTKVHIGAVSNQRVRAIMEAADAFLLPCRRAPNGDMDGLPVVLLEAACRGLLLITSQVSSIPDFVEDGVTGMVAKPGDAEAFTAAVRKAVHLPPHELRKLRTQALDRIGAEYTSDVVTNTLITTWCQ